MYKYPLYIYYKYLLCKKIENNFRLSIVNLCKEESLYNEGLRPLLYSIEDAKTRAVGWRRCGENIAYYRNDSSYVIMPLMFLNHSRDFYYIYLLSQKRRGKRKADGCKDEEG